MSPNQDWITRLERCWRSSLLWKHKLGYHPYICYFDTAAPEWGFGIRLIFLRPHQAEKWRGLFHPYGKAVLAILLTGAGKSLVCRTELALARSRIIQVASS